MCLIKLCFVPLSLYLEFAFSLGILSWGLDPETKANQDADRVTLLPGQPAAPVLKFSSIFRICHR